MIKRVAAEPIYGPGRASRTNYAWSPDSKWLAYSLTNRAGFQQIWLYSLEKDKSTSVTDGLAEAGEPVFDQSGKYLYFLASTDAGPVNNWFDQSNTDMRATATIYLVTLAKATANPLLKESDEEGAADAEKKPADDKTKDDKDKEKDKAEDKEKPATRRRPGRHLVPGRGPAGRIGAHSGSRRRAPRARSTTSADPTAQRQAVAAALRPQEARGRNACRGDRRFPDLRRPQEDPLHLRRARQDAPIGPPAGPPTARASSTRASSTRETALLKLAAISVRVEPRAEWAQILREAWRINRDYFYATNMHGADWNAVWRKYEELLPHLATRDDLNRVMRMMLSELSVGHSFLGGGERLYEPKPMPVGLLGADYEVADGRFRFKTIYGGAYWDPSLRARSTAPGVDVKPGDFLLAIDGKEIKADSEVYRAFEGTAGKRVELKVGPKADGSGARTVVVEPHG